jgi:FkbM family methyltransferase
MAATRLIEALRRQMRRRLKLDIISAGNTTTLRHQLEQVLRAYRVDTVLDVGANEGQFAGQVRELGFTGTIHSFEPVRQTFSTLQRKASGDAGWHCHHLALGRQPGRLTMNLSEFSSFNSMLAPNDFGAERFHDQRVVGQEEVEVSTLDAFVAQHVPADARIFLKMDTQGFDLEVFAGGERSLERVHALLSELSLMPIYTGMPRYTEALAAYESKGFSVSGFFPVNSNDDLSLIEADCLMVRRAATRE